ncbi:MAG: V-type ATP synthase subunit D [Lentisphaeria bacterium]
MPRLNVSPTKSGLLALKRQLAFAEEGRDLLEQKRQILIFELMRRLERTGELEQRVADAYRRALTALREAALDIGSAALERAALGGGAPAMGQGAGQRLAGVRLPRLQAPPAADAAPFGVGGTSASTDAAARRFAALPPLLAELAELETAVRRLAGELRKTQRRCNALTKVFIPRCRETVTYIAESLEEREREERIILKMTRDRLAAAAEVSATA